MLMKKTEDNVKKVKEYVIKIKKGKFIIKMKLLVFIKQRMKMI